MDKYTSVVDHSSSFQRLLKPKEVAEMLSVSRSYAYHLLQTEAIPVVRLGKACRVRPQDLKAFIEKNLHGQAGESIASSNQGRSIMLPFLQACPYCPSGPLGATIWAYFRTLPTHRTELALLPFLELFFKEEG